MPRDKRLVEAALVKKGFQLRTGDHNYFIYIGLDGKKSLARTKTSFGRGFDIDDWLLSQMARQCGLTRQNFLRLIDCPLDREGLEHLLRQAQKL